MFEKTPALLSSKTPSDFVQSNENEWNPKRRTRLEHVYHSVPLPQYSILAGLASLQNMLEESNHARAFFIHLPQAVSGKLPLTSLHLANDKNARIILPAERAPISSRACAKNVDCKKKVVFLPSGVIDRNSLSQRALRPELQSRAMASEVGGLCVKVDRVENES